MDGYDTYGGPSPPPLSRIDSRDRDTYPRDSREVYRERRRSPGADRRPRGGRGRSRSPVQIDRYQPERVPRDEYYNGRNRDDYSRTRRRSSPKAPFLEIDRYVPGDEPMVQRPIPTNQLRDPLLENTQVGFSYFAEWWKKEQEIKVARERQKNGGRRTDAPKEESREEVRAKIQAAYDQYKVNWNARMAKLFVHAHKYDTWFRERYVPELRNPLRERLLDHRRGLFSTWDDDVQNGTFDEFTLEGIYKSESNGVGGMLEKEEGEASAAAEVLAVSDLLPSKGGEIRDPAAFQPTLLVKTIAPAVSRDNMEAFCKEHLGEGEGGFKWLSLSDPNPGKKFHRMGWIILNPGPDQVVDEQPQERREDREVDGENGEQEEGAMDEDKPSTILTASDVALSKINNQTIHDAEKGDFTVHVGIHRPPEAPRKKALWDLFSAPERVARDLELAIRLVHKLDEELGEGYSGVAKIEQRVEELAGKGELQPPLPASSGAKKVTKESDDMEDGEDGAIEEGEEEEGAYDEEVDDEELLIKKKKLDLLIEYLRRVYNFCFYCVFECDSVHELQRKCAGGHLRRPRASLTTAAKETAKASATGEPFPLRKDSAAGDEDLEGSPVQERKPKSYGGKSQLQKAYNWVKTFEEKLLQILEPENVDIRKLGGKPLEEGLEEELGKFVKQEDEQKWRCKAPDCTKLFKGQQFWRKHVEKRHTEWYEKLKEDIELINRYVLDPARLAQGRNDASSNGHFPVNNLQSGTPRNFSLNNMPFYNGVMPAGMAGNPAAGAFSNPFVPGFSMPMASGWGGNAEHGVGPMRNGMRMNNRASGPYDRGTRDSRRSFNGGRLTPPRVGGAGGRPRGPFMEGGVGTFGTGASVEGRTMKSYNDLDATTGSAGGGELDY